ncbi:MAG TPA: fibro-slime domain-containing protein, partial [Polyangiaceae bacterium]
MHLRRTRVSISWLSIALAVWACGCSRTGLLASDPCEEEGDVRPCANRCGNDGEQICEHGFWRTCVVPPKVLACNNACGSGTASCVNNVMSACEVPDEPVRACEMGCGTGSQICRAGAWGQCEWVDGPRQCSDQCSESGLQYCVNNAWGPCETPRIEEPCFSACGDGKKVCSMGHWSSCDAPLPLPPKLHATIRDFTPATNSDFERPLTGEWDDRGVLQPTLGDDDIPVFASQGPTTTISGPASFDTWYRDVPGVNMTTTRDFQMAEDPQQPGLFVYQDGTFFPIDGELFGNYASPRYGTVHNYHFTLTAKFDFIYVGGETFSFTGDDDMWVFINRQIAIDLGGLHSPET